MSGAKTQVHFRLFFFIMEANTMNPDHIARSTVKPVLRGCSKIDKAKVLKTNGSLMKGTVAKLTCIKP